MWNDVKPGAVVGGLWPDDPDGNAWSDPNVGFPPAAREGRLHRRRPRRFPLGGSDYSAQINAFKDQGVEILTGVLPPPDFGNFWAQAQQQGLKPDGGQPRQGAAVPRSRRVLSEPARALVGDLVVRQAPDDVEPDGPDCRRSGSRVRGPGEEAVDPAHRLRPLAVRGPRRRHRARAGGVEDKQALLDAMGETTWPPSPARSTSPSRSSPTSPRRRSSAASG